MKQKQFFTSCTTQNVFDNITEEQKKFIHFNLYKQDTTYIKDFAKKIKKKNIAIIGIGGSILGAKAIYEALLNKNRSFKNMIFLDTVDPIELDNRIKNIDLEDTFFFVITKSGTTVETIAMMKYINSLVNLDKTNCSIMTKGATLLEKYAKSQDIPFFEIPYSLSGRFSVFSVVGLVPLAAVGVDVDKLLKGLKDSQKDYSYIYKAIFIARTRKLYSMNVIFAYSSRLKSFNEWYVQLWAESLGKINEHGDNEGITPIGLIGPNDQHSFLQLIIDGVRDKIVTVIKVKEHIKKVIPENSKREKKYLSNILDNVSFNKLINLQCDSLMETLKKVGTVPYDVIELDELNEYEMGNLMGYYQLLTAATAACLNINAYNQPAVQDNKVILTKKLIALRKEGA